MSSGSASPPSVARDPILVVDDDKPLLEMWRAALDPLFDVSTATSTREAESLMHKKAFKVIVSDHLMPGGNGLNFLVRMREEYPRTQRILVTGYMKPEMLLRSVNEAGLVRYFLKPVTLGDLIRTIQEAVQLHDSFK
jgi:DNA-binding NtrC family response regulator